MMYITDLFYQPSESETEKASYAYLISIFALVVGMPLPFINLLATLLFFAGIKRSTYFVTWHSTQALLYQLFLFLINSIAVVWSITIALGPVFVTNYYVAYVITAFLCNIAGFLTTIISAVNTRKGKHVTWWFFGALTNIIVKQKNEKSFF